MRTSEADIIIVPGLHNSGPDHWQTRWQQKLSTARRVIQDNWDAPDHAAWTQAIARAVNESQKPVILIAHSLGVAATAHAAPLFEKDRVKGAFLVAPPSEEWLRAHPLSFGAFEKHPRDPLPFPSLLVGSRNDPHASYEAVEDLAFAWGSAIKDAGEVGHINAASGHGPWPEGLMSLAAFLARL
jgi:predicted alpha/beta hydrolase family esterase